MRPSGLSGLASTNQSVPRPGFRWGSRVALPLTMIASAMLLVGGTLMGSLQQVHDVEALPVVERPAKFHRSSGSGSSGGAALVQAAGWVEADPFAIAVPGLAAGTIKEVLALEGESIEAGQVVARLVDDDARLALAAAEADLAAAQSNWDRNIENRRAVASTAARVRETSASLAMARAELDGELALGAEAERVWKRFEGLQETGSASANDRGAAKAEWRSRAASVEVARARVDMLAAALDIAQAEADAAAEYAEARTEDRLRLENARVAADAARLLLSRMEIRSIAGGVVLRRLVFPGSRLMIDANDPEAAQVLQLFDPSQLQVRVDVPLADAAKIGVGTEAEVLVEMLPGNSFRGTVMRIVGEADIQKNTLQVKVRIHDPVPQLRPEMLVRARFFGAKTPGRDERETASRAVYAPPGTQEGSTWVVAKFDGSEGLAEQRAITFAGPAEVDGWREVASGLNPGDLVITSGAEGLSADARVRVVRATEGE